MALTQKQEAFCLAYIETGNASEAYRKAYNATKMKPASVNVKASELLADGKVTVRVAELRGAAAERNEVTVDSLIAELEEAREIAKQEAQPSAMVSATMGKAKITGHDKQIIEHSGPGGGPIQQASLTAEEFAVIARETAQKV